MLKLMGPKVTDVLKDIIYLLSNHVDSREDGDTKNKRLTVRAAA